VTGEGRFILAAASTKYKVNHLEAFDEDEFWDFLMCPWPIIETSDTLNYTYTRVILVTLLIYSIRYSYFNIILIIYSRGLLHINR
jgi:hypothetical protein